MFLISGEPNLGKTSLARTALSLGSHPDFLYAFTSSKEFVCSLAEKTSFLIIVGKVVSFLDSFSTLKFLDDINSANFAMATSMLAYEGTIKGTKKDGPTRQVI